MTQKHVAHLVDPLVANAARMFEVTETQVRTRRSGREAKHARWLVWLVLRKRHEIPAVEIAETFAVDRASVAHGLKEMEAMVADTPKLAVAFISLSSVHS